MSSLSWTPTAGRRLAALLALLLTMAIAAAGVARPAQAATRAFASRFSVNTTGDIAQVATR